jgi:CDP-diacylglycerol--glycerol-3-phosphate 3-phosphatidyltransferase
MATGSQIARDIRTLPNLITLSRIVLVLVAALVFIFLDPMLGLGISIIAGATDYLDGIVARRTGQVTRLGEILDQFSDLVFECSCFLIMMTLYGPLMDIAFIAYLVRETWVATIRRYTAEQQINIPSTIFGKLKTNFLGWSFVLLVVHAHNWLPQLEPFLGWLAYFGVCGGLCFAYFAAFTYTKAFVAGYDRAEPVRVAVREQAEGKAPRASHGSGTG